MNVEQNIGYALKIRKRPKGEIQAEVKRMLELVQLEGFERRKPGELSGGQKQRVAIARSLINRPKLLLLDEPLGALDLQLRRQMQQELKRLQKKLGITFIYITHDQEEALNMSDRIAVMRDGRFDQVGTPSDVYDSPRTSYVARFVGEANIVRGKAGSVSGELGGVCRRPGKGGVPQPGLFLRPRPGGHSGCSGRAGPGGKGGKRPRPCRRGEGEELCRRDAPHRCGAGRRRGVYLPAPRHRLGAGPRRPGAGDLGAGAGLSRGSARFWEGGVSHGQGHVPFEKTAAPGRVSHDTAADPVHPVVYCGAFGVHGGPELYDPGGDLGGCSRIYPA